MNVENLPQTGIVVLYKELPTFDAAALQQHLSNLLGDSIVSADKVNPKKYLIEWAGAAFGLTCARRRFWRGRYYKP